ncbi:MAG: peptidoglycan DD-metalloendopeptidase family protein [Acidimicrobiia bacterium]|nr:peptidoglycan DD-metalloendopeptidase family protein [Acidimicrobiia bacterium]
MVYSGGNGGMAMGDRRKSARRPARLLLVLLMLSGTMAASGPAAVADDEPYPLTFPVVGSSSWGDTWGAPRSGGRTHKGTDIFADKGTPVVAAAAGTIEKIAVGERAGRYIAITHDDGWRTLYIHLDNDTPGTDDGLGGAPAPGIAVGVRVEAGDVIDYLGDSGNAENTPPHLHFELHRPDGTAINPAPHLRFAVTGAFVAPESVEVAPAASFPSYDAEGIDPVGHVDPGGGFAAGLAVNQGIVYMGTWGRPEACPNSGVRVIDATDPGNPTVLATLAGADEFPATSTDGVWAGSLATEAFTGDLAIVGVRLCDTSERTRRSEAFRGLAIYDVTTPEAPTLLGTLHSGDLTQGPNDVVAAVDADGSLLVSTTVMQSFRHTDGVTGDWRLVDASDPTAPQQIADWDYRAGFAEDDPRRGDVNLHAHTSTLAPDASSVWVAVWDAGMVQLDLTTPDSPALTAQVGGGEGDPGNAHSVVVDPERNLLIRTSEDLEWRDDDGETNDWGAQIVYDISDVDDPAVLSAFATENQDLSTGKPPRPGYFSAHEIDLVNHIEYLTWYSDGLRVVDLSDPAQPEEVAYFIPPPTPDPQNHFLGQGRGSAFAMVWSVEIADGFIYVSDMNSGLWILRLAAGDIVDAAAL